MKTLILYNSETGDVISTQSPVEHDNYAVLVADVNEEKQLIGVKNGELLYADPAEIVEKRERLEALTEEMSNLKKDLLAYEIGVINDGQ